MAAACLSLAGCGDSPGSPSAGASSSASPASVGSAPGDAHPAPGQDVGGPAPVSTKVDTSAWKLQPPFYAVGEEPAWQLNLNDEYFTFSRGSGIPEIDTPFVAPTQVKGADVFNAETFKITIEPGDCSVANQTGVASVTIQMGGITYDGCAFKGRSGDTAAGPSSDEADLIQDLPGALAAVDSCLAKMGDPAVISAIYPRGDEAVGIAMRGRAGALFECEAHSAAGPADSVDQIEASSAGPWLKSSARFLRQGIGDASKCSAAKPVVVGGKQLGVMLPKSCKF